MLKFYNNEKLFQELSEITTLFNTWVHFNSEYEETNQAGEMGFIRIGKCTSKDILLSCFFHELGHYILDKNLPEYECYKTNIDRSIWIIGRELQAWDIGFKIMNKWGYKITPQMISKMSQCLQTYLTSDTNVVDMKIYMENFLSYKIKESSNVWYKNWYKKFFLKF